MDSMTLLLVFAGFLIGALSLLFGGGVYLAMLLLFALDAAGVADCATLATVASISKLAGLARGVPFIAGSWGSVRPKFVWLLHWGWPMALPVFAGTFLAVAAVDVEASRLVVVAAMVLGIFLTESRCDRTSAVAGHPLSRGVLGLYIGFIGAGSGLLLRAGLTQARPAEEWDDAVIEPLVLSRVIETLLAVLSLAVLIGTGSMNWPIAIPYACGAALAGSVTARWLSSLKARASAQTKIRITRASYLAALAAIALA